MSDATNTPVVDVTPLETKAEASQVDAATQPTAAPVSPAKDLRDLQQLLVLGIFPGNMAPAVVKGYQLLDHMCSKIEGAVKEAGLPNEVK